MNVKVSLIEPTNSVSGSINLFVVSKDRINSFRTKLVARGKATPKVATAVARELTGLIWAIAREVPAPRA